MLPVRTYDQRFTYRDYSKWPSDERWELIDGKAYAMSSPSTAHQRVCIALATQFYNSLKDKKCEVFIAPFDVRLPEANEADDDVETVVQPDITVICDPNKIDDKGCRGTPDLIVEIISPSTASMDYIKKFRLYEHHGVKEYWLVHPSYKVVNIHRLNDAGKYEVAENYSENDTVEIKILSGMTIDLKPVFEKI